eukprot:TRINITY_DN7756_c0_g2_i1.p1 TRINITY_DN7756_c0_g2~~TRINITY_DN7756_c0_g2_i1.p1  ORF type:complete len:454 (+),score=127.20 TRINITY_DN7756_c0_g2_i1:2-1363(+)
MEDVLSIDAFKEPEEAATPLRGGDGEAEGSGDESSSSAGGSQCRASHISGYSYSSAQQSGRGQKWLYVNAGRYVQLARAAAFVESLQGDEPLLLVPHNQILDYGQTVDMAQNTFKTIRDCCQQLFSAENEAAADRQAIKEELYEAFRAHEDALARMDAQKRHWEEGLQQPEADRLAAQLPEAAEQGSKRPAADVAAAAMESESPQPGASVSLAAAAAKDAAPCHGPISERNVNSSGAASAQATAAPEHAEGTNAPDVPITTTRAEDVAAVLHANAPGLVAAPVSTAAVDSDPVSDAHGAGASVFAAVPPVTVTAAAEACKTVERCDTGVEEHSSSSSASAEGAGPETGAARAEIDASPAAAAPAAVAAGLDGPALLFDQTASSAAQLTAAFSNGPSSGDGEASQAGKRRAAPVQGHGELGDGVDGGQGDAKKPRRQQKARQGRDTRQGSRMQA